MSTKTICRNCGTETVVFDEKRRGEPVQMTRDYEPVTFVIKLKVGTETTYIVPVSVEKLPFRIRSCGDGKLNYSVDVPLSDTPAFFAALRSDERIEEWHTDFTEDGFGTAALHGYSDEDGLKVLEICHDHEGQSKDYCEECLSA